MSDHVWGMNLQSRLLGLAFAAADALFELDAEGVVTFALGAGPSAARASAAIWMGAPLTDVMDAASRSPVQDALAALKSGGRSPAVHVLVDCSGGQVRRAVLKAFRLPELEPATSCALTYDGPAFALELPTPPPLLDAKDLLRRAREQVEADQAVTVAFVDVPGLAALAGEEAGRRATTRIEASLQAASLDGAGAAVLTPERFAVLRRPGDDLDLAAAVRDAALAEGLTLNARTSDAAVGPDTPLNALRALRFTIEACLREEAPPADAGATFADGLKRTLREAEQFQATVRGRAFALHYQPIVDLRTGAVHHFEALARFDRDKTPAHAIHMAEELGLIENFDLAVAEKAVQRLRQPGGGLLKIAVNVSGASLAGDAYVSGLLRLTATAPDDRRRLIIEVTETAALADLEAADRRLKALKQAGIRACIDDFGAGAAAFDYLRRLTVDAVKIDGGLVRDIASDARARTLLTHLVELCASLKVETIAEMIETEAVADALRAMGVGYGQGWLFGRAEPDPVTVRPAASTVRRRGVVEGWG